MDLSYLRRNINYWSYKNLKIFSHKRKTKGNLSICKKYPTSHPLIPIQEILIPKDADAQEDTPLKSRMKNKSSRGFHFRFDAYRSSLRSTYLPYLEDIHNETIHDTCIQEARHPKFAYMCPRDSSHVLYARVRARAAMARADHVAKQ